jgi:hypothetical protein
METAKEYVEAFVSETIDAETGVRRYTLFGDSFYIDAKGHGFYSRIDKRFNSSYERLSNVYENYMYMGGTNKHVATGYDSKVRALIRYTQENLGIGHFDYTVKNGDVRKALRTISAEHLSNVADVESALNEYLAENTFTDEAIKVAQEASINNDEILAITQREDISDEENLKRLELIKVKARELVDLIDSLSTYAYLTTLDIIGDEYADMRHYLTTALSEEVEDIRANLT